METLLNSDKSKTSHKFITTITVIIPTETTNSIFPSILNRNCYSTEWLKINSKTNVCLGGNLLWPWLQASMTSLWPCMTSVTLCDQCDSRAWIVIAFRPKILKSFETNGDRIDWESIEIEFPGPIRSTLGLIGGFSLNTRNMYRVTANAMPSYRPHWKTPPEKMRERQFSSMETSWFLVEFTRTKFNFKLKLIMFISGHYESSMCSVSIFKAIKCGHMTCSKGRTAACTISCRWTDPMMILTQAVFTVWLYCWSIFHHFAMNLASAIFLIDANSIFSQVGS